MEQTLPDADGMSLSTLVETVPLPLLDLQRPENLETATFAMG